MNSHKITSLVEVVGIILVITPIIGRHLDFHSFWNKEYDAHYWPYIYAIRYYLESGLRNE